MPCALSDGCCMKYPVVPWAGLVTDGGAWSRRPRDGAQNDPGVHRSLVTGLASGPGWFHPSQHGSQDVNADSYDLQRARADFVREMSRVQIMGRSC